jgi:hypothetical protein
LASSRRLLADLVPGDEATVGSALDWLKDVGQQQRDLLRAIDEALTVQKWLEDEPQEQGIYARALTSLHQEAQQMGELLCGGGPAGLSGDVYGTLGPYVVKLCRACQDLARDAERGILNDTVIERYINVSHVWGYEFRRLKELLVFAKAEYWRNQKGTVNEKPAVSEAATGTRPDGPEGAPSGQAEPEIVMDDPTAFRPASEFIDEERFPDLKAIHKALRANPWIRAKRPIGKNGKPIPNRLLIHAGDWQEFRQQKQAVDPLDLPARLVDDVMETERRKAESREKKGGPEK